MEQKINIQNIKRILKIEHQENKQPNQKWFMGPNRESSKEEILWLINIYKGVQHP